MFETKGVQSGCLIKSDLHIPTSAPKAEYKGFHLIAFTTCNLLGSRSDGGGGLSGD